MGQYQSNNYSNSEYIQQNWIVISSAYQNFVGNPLLAFNNNSSFIGIQNNDQNNNQINISNKGLQYIKQVAFQSKQIEQKNIQIYQYRKKFYSSNIIKILHFQTSQVQYINIRKSKIHRVITQWIPLRVNDIKLELIQQCLYIIYGAINGMKQLIKYYPKLFDLNEKMIGICYDGSIKIWINENFSENFIDSEKKQQEQLQNCNQENSIKNIINLIIKKIPNAQLTNNQKIYQQLLTIKSYQQCLQRLKAFEGRKQFGLGILFRYKNYLKSIETFKNILKESIQNQERTLKHKNYLNHQNHPSYINLTSNSNYSSYQNNKNHQTCYKNHSVNINRSNNFKNASNFTSKSINNSPSNIYYQISHPHHNRANKKTYLNYKTEQQQVDAFHPKFNHLKTEEDDHQIDKYTTGNFSISTINQKYKKDHYSNERSSNNQHNTFNSFQKNKNHSNLTHQNPHKRLSHEKDNSLLSNNYSIGKQSINQSHSLSISNSPKKSFKYQYSKSPIKYNNNIFKASLSNKDPLRNTYGCSKSYNQNKKVRLYKNKNQFNSDKQSSLSLHTFIDENNNDNISHKNRQLSSSKKCNIHFSSSPKTHLNQSKSKQKQKSNQRNKKSKQITFKQVSNIPRFIQQRMKKIEQKAQANHNKKLNKQIVHQMIRFQSFAENSNSNFNQKQVNNQNNMNEQNSNKNIKKFPSKGILKKGSSKYIDSAAQSVKKIQNNEQNFKTIQLVNDFKKFFNIDFQNNRINNISDLASCQSRQILTKRNNNDNKLKTIFIDSQKNQSVEQIQEECENINFLEDQEVENINFLQKENFTKKQNKCNDQNEKYQITTLKRIKKRNSCGFDDNQEISAAKKQLQNYRSQKRVQETNNYKNGDSQSNSTNSQNNQNEIMGSNDFIKQYQQQSDHIITTKKFLCIGTECQLKLDQIDLDDYKKRQLTSVQAQYSQLFMDMNEQNQRKDNTKKTKNSKNNNLKQLDMSYNNKRISIECLNYGNKLTDLMNLNKNNNNEDNDQQRKSKTKRETSNTNKIKKRHNSIQFTQELKSQLRQKIHQQEQSLWISQNNRVNINNKNTIQMQIKQNSDQFSSSLSEFQNSNSKQIFSFKQTESQNNNSNTMNQVLNTQKIKNQEYSNKMIKNKNNENIPIKNYQQGTAIEKDKRNNIQKNKNKIQKQIINKYQIININDNYMKPLYNKNSIKLKNQSICGNINYSYKQINKNSIQNYMNNEYINNHFIKKGYQYQINNNKINNNYSDFAFQHKDTQNKSQIKQSHFDNNNNNLNHYHNYNHLNHSNHSNHSNNLNHSFNNPKLNNCLMKQNRRSTSNLLEYNNNNNKNNNNNNHNHNHHYNPQFNQNNHNYLPHNNIHRKNTKYNFKNQYSNLVGLLLTPNGLHPIQQTERDINQTNNPYSLRE